MEKLIKTTLSINKNNPNKAMSFEDLLGYMKEEIAIYESFGIEEELMKQEIVFNIYDYNGAIIEAFPTSFIGFLAGGDVCITGDLKEVHE